MDKRDFEEIISGSIPPYIMRFIKGVGKTINNYKMIQGGDKVLIAVSGGKDSLALSLALSIRRKWLPVDYSLSALMIDWLEHPIGKDEENLLLSFFSALNIDFKIVREEMFPSSFKDNFNCYLCSRNRRRILFGYAEKIGASLIATGHHLDDLVETTMMNLFFRGSFSTMLPVQEFFDGKMYVIRPMIETRESTIRRITEGLSMPVVKPVCPYERVNVRASLKPIISSLSHIDKLCREHLYSSHDFSSCVMKERNKGENGGYKD